MKELRVLLVVAVLGWAAVAPGTGQAQGPRVFDLIAAGKYDEAAGWYESLYRAAAPADTDDLFNAAFYWSRHGDTKKAVALAAEYRKAAGCETTAGKQPRRMRHCALAAEIAGDLDRALALFEEYRRVARLWEHRSRADGGIERVKLRKEVKAQAARISKLEAEAAKCAPSPRPAP